MILAAWFKHPEESFCYKEVQFKKFCLPVKTSCPQGRKKKKGLIAWDK